MLRASKLLRLRLFGGLSIVGENGPLTGRAVQKRRLAVVALLAASPEHMVARDKLVAYVWPENNPESSRHLLAVTVYELRKVLGEDALLSAGDSLRLDPAVVSMDLDDFAAALAAGEWERAVDLYAGPFLDGFFIPGAAEFERWVEGERERLSHLYGEALASLAEQRTAAGDLRGAVAAWRRLAAHQRHNSAVAIGLMLALEAVGDRNGALQHARVHSALVRDEFGTDASPEVLALAERLQSASVPAPVANGLGPEQLQRELDRLEPVAGAVRVPSAAASDEPSPRLPGSREARTGAGPGGKPRRAHLRDGVTAVALAVVILAAVWLARGSALGGPGEGDLPTIAVLPFVDTSPDQDAEYLGDGITDELISTLAQADGLRVAARTSSFAFKGRSATARTIGEELGVGAILEGSIRRTGDRLRVHAQLVSARDGYNLWAQTYERDIRAAVGIEGEIARAVIERLHGRSARGGDVSPTKSQSQSVEAYHLYLHGRYFWHRRDDPQRRVENLERSIDYFQQALALDPGYAHAYAGLADSYASLVGRLPRAEAFARAKAAAERALELDERLAEAHVALARILVFEEWNWTEAGRAYRRALELSPNDATARQWYAMYLLHLGLVEGAIREIRYAQQLDPLSLSVNNDAGRILYNARLYDEAVEQFRKTLELDPTSADAYLHLGLLSLEQGSLETALAHFRRWGELSGQQPAMLVAYAYAAAGRQDVAQHLLAQLLQGAGSARMPPAGIALVYAQLGEADQAFEWLDRAFQERSSFLLFLKVTPRLDPLRSDPRFAQLLRRMALE